MPHALNQMLEAAQGTAGTATVRRSSIGSLLWAVDGAELGCGCPGWAAQSTLFNALVKNGKAQAANFPFCTIEPNVGMVAVPDLRLSTLSKMANSQKTVRRPLHHPFHRSSSHGGALTSKAEAPVSSQHLDPCPS